MTTKLCPVAPSLCENSLATAKPGSRMERCLSSSPLPSIMSPSMVAYLKPLSIVCLYPPVPRSLLQKQRRLQFLMSWLLPSSALLFILAYWGTGLYVFTHPPQNSRWHTACL